jgi:hypothetical protein
MEQINSCRRPAGALYFYISSNPTLTHGATVLRHPAEANTNIKPAKRATYCSPRRQHWEKE